MNFETVAISQYLTYYGPKCFTEGGIYRFNNVCEMPKSQLLSVSNNSTFGVLSSVLAHLIELLVFFMQISVSKWHKLVFSSFAPGRMLPPKRQGT
jgi:hypothetical protein